MLANNTKTSTNMSTTHTAAQYQAELAQLLKGPKLPEDASPEGKALRDFIGKMCTEINTLRELTMATMDIIEKHAPSKTQGEEIQKLLARAAITTIAREHNISYEAATLRILGMKFEQECDN